MQFKTLCCFSVMVLAMFITGCDDSGKNKSDSAPAKPAVTAAPSAQTTEAGISIAVINTSTVFKESEGGKAGAAHLDALAKELQAELMTLQAESKNGKNVEATAKMQARLGDMQQRFEAEQQMVINTLNGAYQKVLDEYREAEKIVLVINQDTALSFSAKVDITPKVIARMNLTPVTYTALGTASKTAPATNATAPAPAAPKAATNATQDKAPAKADK